MKFQVENYNLKATCHAKLYLDPKIWVVWVNTQFAIVKILCLFLFLSHVHRSHQWKDLTSYMSYNIFPCMCLLGVALILLHIYGVTSPKNPILGARVGISKPNA